MLVCNFRLMWKGNKLQLDLKSFFLLVRAAADTSLILISDPKRNHLKVQFWKRDSRQKFIEEDATSTLSFNFLLSESRRLPAFDTFLNPMIIFVSKHAKFGLRFFKHLFSFLRCFWVLVIKRRRNVAQILNVLPQFLLRAHFLPTLEETFATNLFTFSHAPILPSSGCLLIYHLFIICSPSCGWFLLINLLSIHESFVWQLIY